MLDITKLRWMGPPKFEFGFLSPRDRRMDQATLRPLSEKRKWFLVLHHVVDKVLMRQEHTTAAVSIYT